MPWPAFASEDPAVQPGTIVNYGDGFAAAQTAGIGAEDWDAAAAGWGQRMQGGTAVGQKFNQLYMGG